VSVRDVHADLFRLLMTGRSREAVSEWLGNKLTGRVSPLLDKAKVDAGEMGAILTVHFSDNPESDF
jgi:hypothetical protein